MLLLLFSGQAPYVPPIIPVEPSIPDSGGFIVNTRGNQTVYRDMLKHAREQELKEQLIREEDEIITIIVAISQSVN